MMMNSGTWERAPLSYATVETLLDDVSKQMSLSNLSRYSRGSNGQRAGPTGGSMRVAKPNSASNSPRGSIGLGRRRTVMTDGYRRRMAMMDQNVVISTSAGFVSNDGLQVPSRSTRPVSWHPSSHQAPQQHYQTTNPAPTFDFTHHAQYMDLPPTPAVYSGYTSPSSTFSPLSLPYTGYEQQQQYPFHDTSTPCQTNPTYAFSQPVMMEQQTQNYHAPTAQNADPAMYSHFDWTNFATNGFESSTAPPTPENFLPIQHPEPAFPVEESIPYHPLSDTESIGEDLIGVGLYDTPEAAKSPSPDPQLDNYRSLMMTGLLGSAYRRPEPAGKGLKLEEGWNPPDSDDDDEESDEQDGEGEDDDEVAEEETKSQNVTYPVQGVQQFDTSNWV